MKSNNKKVLIILFIIIVISVFLTVLANKYSDFINERYSIESRIGSKSTGGQVSVYEYKILIEKTVGPYLKALQAKDIQTAYSYHTAEYNEYVSYEEFIEQIENSDYSSYSVAGVVQLTQNMYKVLVEMSDGKEKEFLIIISEQKANIVPESFLVYVDVDKSITKKGVKYELKGYKVMVDKCIFYASIENNTDKEISITSTKMITTGGATKSAPNGKLAVSANTKLDLEFEFDTSLAFPQVFKIEKTEKNKIRTYEFKL